MASNEALAYPRSEHDDDVDVVAWEAVRQVQNGDADAFARLYETYVELVFHYILRRVGHRPTAEDLTSETFLRAFRRIDSLIEQRRAVGAWFITIARNLLLDHLKASPSRREIITECIDDTSTPALGPEESLTSALREAELLHCVNQLSAQQQQCIRLRFFDGKSVAETAHIMGKNAGSIKAMQHRAVRRLAELFTA